MRSPLNNYHLTPGLWCPLNWANSHFQIGTQLALHYRTLRCQLINKSDPYIVINLIFNIFFRCSCTLAIFPRVFFTTSFTAVQAQTLHKLLIYTCIYTHVVLVVVVLLLHSTLVSATIPILVSVHLKFLSIIYIWLGWVWALFTSQGVPPSSHTVAVSKTTVHWGSLLAADGPEGVTSGGTYTGISWPQKWNWQKTKLDKWRGRPLAWRIFTCESGEDSTARR